MYELFTDRRKSYKSDDGNYYTYPRREHEIKRFEKPSIIQIIIRGIIFHDIILMMYILISLFRSTLIVMMIQQYLY